MKIHLLHAYAKLGVNDLAPREAQNSVAERLQCGVALMVALDRHPVAVAVPAVGLDDEPVLGPGEVDGVGADAVVDLRSRQAGGLDEREEAALELRAGRSAVEGVEEACVDELVRGDEPAVEGFGAEAIVVGVAPEVFERLGGSGDMEACVTLGLGCGAVVDGDRVAFSRSPGRERDVDQLRH